MRLLLIQLAISIVVVSVGGFLDALGGKHWLFCRRQIMPFLLGVGISLIVHSVFPVWYAWLAGLTVLPAYGTLTLGYFNGDNSGRALWIWVQALSLGGGLALASTIWHLHMLAWWLFLIYTVLAGVLGGLYKNWKQWKGDWITGSYLCGLIVFVWLSVLFKL